MSKTSWQEVYRESPRYEAIAGVFKLIEKPNALVNEIWAKANRVMVDLNGEEREKLPAFVKTALADREPVRVGPPNML
jgi:hypothetical protein